MLYKTIFTRELSLGHLFASEGIWNLLLYSQRTVLFNVPLLSEKKSGPHCGAAFY